MYGLPSNINLMFLKDVTLLQVCIGLNDLILNFNSDISISITSKIEFQIESNKIQTYVNFKNAAKDLMTLIDQPVVKVIGNENGTIKLLFKNGSTLIILDDSKEFESYVIKNKNKLIVV